MPADRCAARAPSRPRRRLEAPSADPAAAVFFRVALRLAAARALRAHLTRTAEGGE